MTCVCNCFVLCGFVDLHFEIDTIEVTDKKATRRNEI